MSFNLAYIGPSAYQHIIERIEQHPDVVITAFYDMLDCAGYEATIAQHILDMSKPPLDRAMYDAILVGQELGDLLVNLDSGLLDPEHPDYDPTLLNPLRSLRRIRNTYYTRTIIINSNGIALLGNTPLRNGDAHIEQFYNDFCNMYEAWLYGTISDS